MSLRERKVADLLKRELSHVIHRELKDPRVGFVTITRVVMSADLKQAKIYFSTLETAERAAIMLQVLTHAAEFIRVELKKHLHLKYIPYLHFYVDDTLAYAAKIEALIEETKKNRAESS